MPPAKEKGLAQQGLFCAGGRLVRSIHNGFTNGCFVQAAHSVSTDELIRGLMWAAERSSVEIFLVK